MILDVCTYLLVFMITGIMVSIYQKYCNRIIIKTNWGIISSKSYIMYSLLGCCFLFPIIAMYGLRYGIGTDYFNYESIYNVLHDTDFSDYWSAHSDGIGYYYVEVLYYVLNTIMPSYVMLQWLLITIICVVICLALREYYGQINYAYAFFIYLSTQFIFAMNATRFSVGLCFILLSYIALAKGRDIRFFLFVLIASLFHTSALFCLPLYFLKEYKYRYVNRIRNIIVLFFILLFPFLTQYLFDFAANLVVFARYFATSMYSISADVEGGFMWLIHVIPVILPLILFCRKEIFCSSDSSIYFRICLMEIPFRMLGQYNTWFTRYTRCSQIVLVVFIPLILSRIENKQKRLLLEIYYVIWYIFYFAYYAIVNDQGDSLPYMWILS